MSVCTTKITGITARSASFSAVNCDASLVKTGLRSGTVHAFYPSVPRTKTRCKQLRVEVGEKLLALCVELAHSRDNVAGRANADNFHDSLEDEKGEVGEIGV